MKYLLIIFAVLSLSIIVVNVVPKLLEAGNLLCR